MIKLILLALCVVAVLARTTNNERIVGGSVTTINNYPEIVSTHYSATGLFFQQFCGGSILNQRSILTAAHCFDNGRNVASRWRVRVGSTFASSGGVVHNTNQLILHPNYRERQYDNDIAVMRLASSINYVNNAAQPANIAGTNYNLADNQVVWAAGWGATESASFSEQLRHVQIWSINQAICRQRYGSVLTDNMLCSGWLNVGGRDQCQGDSGGPLYHNRVVVGVCSWGAGCADPFFPGVNARVSRYTTWIQQNA